MKKSNSPFCFDNKKNILPKSKRSNSRLHSVITKISLSEFKRSQITIFIIIAILLIAIVAVFFIAKANVLDLVKGINPEVKPVYSFVENCIDKTGQDAVYYIAQSGGYFIPPNLSIESGIAYYIYDGKNYMPSKEQIENEISKYVNLMLFFCVKDFSDFPDFNVKQGEVKTTTIIEDDKVVLKINYPLSISKGEKTYSFSNFNKEINVRLGIIYDVVYTSVNEYMKNEGMCIDCISELIDKNNLYLDMMDYNNETVVFSFVDINSKINNEDFAFYFANKYKNEK